MKLTSLTEIGDNREYLSDILCKEYNSHDGLPVSIVELRDDIFKEILEPIVNLAGYEFDREEVIRMMMY